MRVSGDVVETHMTSNVPFTGRQDVRLLALEWIVKHVAGGMLPGP